MKKLLLLLPAFCAGIFSMSLRAQNMGQIHGNFEADPQYYIPDSTIGADTIPEHALFNGWGNINYTNGKFAAGIRYEAYLNKLNGYPNGYTGAGIPYKYASYNNDGLEVTIGSFYEQFGSGLTLRTYEERILGIDNALEGMRVRYTPYHGIYFKGLWGKQRNGMSDGRLTLGNGIVRGFDAEVNLAEVFDTAWKCKTQVILGGSFVSKYQQDLSPLLVLPENVGTWAERMNIICGKINFYAEYAYKINDPSAANGFIYKPGEALFSSITYAQKGLGIYLGLLRTDNMSYRSDRSASLTSLTLNYTPALTRQHTYSLAAYYPFSSQPNGENCLQGEIAYKIKKGSKLGGKYGTNVTLNYAVAYSLDTNNVNDMNSTRYSYSSRWLPFGDSLFFQDLNFEIARKINSKFKFTLLDVMLTYNKNVMEGKTSYPYIHANVTVADLTWHFAEKFSSHTVLEHMAVAKDDAGNIIDHGNWAALTEELSIGEHFYVALIDQYNYGNPEHGQTDPVTGIVSPDDRIHYFKVQGGFNKGTNSISLGYGKQREGIFCVGGVCRQVPASNGFSLTITSSF